LVSVGEEKYYEVNIRSDVEELSLDADGEVSSRPWTLHKIRIFASTPVAAAEIGLLKFIELAEEAKICIRNPKVTSIKDLGPNAAKSRREWNATIQHQNSELAQFDELPEQYDDRFSNENIWWR